MKNSEIAVRRREMESLAGGRAGGFALAEMLVAMAIFLIVAGAAFTLFNQHETLVIQQQSVSSVNIGLRNAMSQLQMDLSQAGQNFVSTVSSNGLPVPAFGLGVVIRNNVPGASGVTACTPTAGTWAYPTAVSSACFDSLAVINPKPCTAAGGTVAPVLTISDASDNLASTTAINVADPNGGNLTNDASCFSSGDEILVLQTYNTYPFPTCQNGAQSNYCMTVTTLTSNATVSGGNIVLAHRASGAVGVPASCPGSSCTDPLGLVYTGGNNNYANALQASPYTTGTYVINLGSGAGDVWYSVVANPSNSTDPQLMRCPGAPCSSTNEQVVVDQVVGFKVGAALWNNQQAGGDLASYFYNAANYCNGGLGASGTNCTTTPPPANDPNDYSLVRSVRISIIGRTQPRVNQTFAQLQNGFDGGPYVVQQSSVVVDLRNLSDSEFGN